MCPYTKMKTNAMKILFLPIFALAVAVNVFAADMKYVHTSAAVVLMSPRTPTQEELAKLPIGFTLPEDYVHRRTEIGILMGIASDIDLVLKSRDFRSLKNGMYVVFVSPTVGFNKEKNQFGGKADSAHVDELVASGASDVKVKRITESSVPALQIQATLGAVRVRIAYFAIGGGNGVGRVSYRHPESQSAIDEENWNVFIQNFAK